MKVIIFCDSETGDIWCYIPDEQGKDAIFIRPRKEEEDDKENEDKSIH